MNDRAYLDIWLALECIAISGGALYRIEGSTCDDIESTLDATFADGSTAHFSYGGAGGGEIRQERSYYFEGVPKVATPDVTVWGDTTEQFDMCVVLINERAIARAWSVRRNSVSAEIAVETDEVYRRRGYGKQVVAAWAKVQTDQGKIGIYSHRSGNLESKALAESVGARHFVDIVSTY